MTPTAGARTTGPGGSDVVQPLATAQASLDRRPQTFAPFKHKLLCLEKLIVIK